MQCPDAQSALAAQLCPLPRPHAPPPALHPVESASDPADVDPLAPSLPARASTGAGSTVPGLPECGPSQSLAIAGNTQMWLVLQQM